MKDLEPWDERDFTPSSFLSEPDGQLTIFYDIDEPPDPDDFDQIDKFDEAWKDWGENRQSSITEQTNQKTPVIELFSQGCLNRYQKKGNYYWRFSYHEGQKTRHIHLCPVKPKKERQSLLIECVREALANKAGRDSIIKMIDLLKN